jgi:hypothetical protein
MSEDYWEGVSSTVLSRCHDAWDKLEAVGFSFDDDFQFSWRYASEHFNAATLWQVFGLAQLLKREQPIPVRGAMYRGIPQLFKDSSDKYYDCCGRLILKMRRMGLIPFDYIADNTRNRRKPSSWSGLADFAETVAQAYRKDFWERQPHYIEGFCEKDAMAGVLEPVTEQYDIHLLPIRGDCSETLCQLIGTQWKQIIKPIFAYYFGDHDPKGFTIERSFRKRIEGYAEKTITWIRLSVTAADFENEDILGFPVKRDKNGAIPPASRAYVEQFGERCIEVDAISANESRRRLEEAILSHVDRHEWETLRLIEAEEKQDLLSKIRTLGGEAA